MALSVVPSRTSAAGARTSRHVVRALAYAFGVAVVLAMAALMATAMAAHAMPIVRPVHRPDSAMRTAAPATRWAPPIGLTKRVAAAIAQRWMVTPERLRLEWDTISSALLATAAPAITDFTPVQLLGTGEGGSWIVLATATPASAPVQLRVRAGTEQTRTVAARDLARDVTLSADDLSTATLLEWGAPRLAGSTPGAGWITRRVHHAGEMLREPAVAPPQLIRAGESVSMLWRDGALELRVVGTAANSAALGERVAIRVDGRRRLEGTATGRGTARLQGRD